MRVSPYGIESQRCWEEENPSIFFCFEYWKESNNKNRVFRRKGNVYIYSTANTRRSLAVVILFRRTKPKFEELLAEWKQNLTKVFRFKEIMFV
jgi:ribosomal protein L36